MNEIKKTAPAKAAPAPKKKSKGIKTARRYVKFLNVFGIFNKDMLVRFMPYVFFLTLIALVYIANSYYAERTIRDIDGITKDLKTLRAEYITGKRDLMKISKQSEVAKAIEPLGIKESVEAPKKIVISTQTEKSSD